MPSPAYSTPTSGKGVRLFRTPPFTVVTCLLLSPSFSRPYSLALSLFSLHCSIYTSGHCRGTRYDLVFLYFLPVAYLSIALSPGLILSMVVLAWYKERGFIILKKHINQISIRGGVPQRSYTQWTLFTHTYVDRHRQTLTKKRTDMRTHAGTSNAHRHTC